MDADARRRREVVPGRADRLVKRDLAWSGGVAAIALLLRPHARARSYRRCRHGHVPVRRARARRRAQSGLSALCAPDARVLATFRSARSLHRINLFSALLGALTVGLAFLIARRLGCRRVIAAAAALGLASGAIFWSQAVIAEVYTLNAAIVAACCCRCLSGARRTARAGAFVAVAMFAAGLGNHTTIVGFVPGIVIFALLTDARFALRPRTLAVTAGMLAGGLLQYVFILWRSSQPDATSSRARRRSRTGRRPARRPVPGTPLCVQPARPVHRTPAVAAEERSRHPSSRLSASPSRLPEPSGCSGGDATRRRCC